MEKIAMKSDHRNDKAGNPAGGMTYGTGYAIIWQDGPLGSGEGQKEPNGAQVEDIIGAAIDRLEFYQMSKFVCEDNGKAIEHLYAALDSLATRTADRISRDVEGTNQQ